MHKFPRLRAFSRGALTLLLLTSAPLATHAADDVSRDAQLLRESTDFRVRTQAALALGASGSKKAVAPLCAALGDDNRTVRIATATAISRLRKGGDDCLQQRLSAENDSNVKAAITKALARLSGAGAEPTLGEATKYLVRVDKLSGPERLNDPVRAALVKGARSSKDVGFVPADQSDVDAKKALLKFPKVRAFQLSPRLSRPEYAGGVLTMRMSVAILDFPGGALIGSFEKSVGMGVEGESAAAENELAVLLAEESMRQFLTLAPSLSR